MNKVLIVLAIITVLGLGGMFVAKRSPKTSPAGGPTPPSRSEAEIPSAVEGPIPTPSPVSKSQLDSDLSKELDQLDKDINSGSEETVTDSEMNIQ